jgi:pimeloyl-ACP methyl ester carboxylesterase
MGEGPPLLLLHGYAGTARWWVRNLAPLARVRTVYALDLPGFGASRMRGRYSFERVTDLLAAWMDTNQLGAADMVGHSMGGQLAMLLASRHTAHVRTLVLIAPAGLPLDSSLIGVGRRAFRSRAGGDQGFTPIVTAGALRAGPRVLWQAARQVREVDVRTHVAMLTVPTLIMWGDRDALLPVANAATLAACIAGAQVRVVQGATHNLFFEQPELTNAAIVEFLSINSRAV